MECSFIRDGEYVQCTRVECGLRFKTTQDVNKIHAECRGRVVLPSLVNQGLSLAKSIGNFVISGAKTLNEEDKEKRMNICRDCPLFIKETERCEKCGCHLKFKISMESEHCPIGKW